MSKTKVVEIVTDNNIQYGQISSPNDLMKAQEFAHLHAELLTKDFLTGTDAEVSGCAYSLPGGLGINVAAGRAYHAGYQFEAAATNLTLVAAHASYARLDYIVATVSGSVPSETTFLPFQRIRTSQELTDGEPAYPPTQFSRATEKHNVAVIQVRTGTPAATPLPPSTIGATDVILYTVMVPANATVLNAGMVNDARVIIANLRGLKQQVTTQNASVGTLQTQMTQALAYETLTRPFEQFGGHANLMEILNEIYAALTVLKVRYPTILSNDCRCPVYTAQESGEWVVDIPVGTAVEFGAKFVGIYAENFPEEVNARYVTLSGDEVDFLHVIKGRTDIKTEGDNETPSGNFIRFDLPGGTKTLTLLENGQLVFRTEVIPSTSTECLLLKITPKSEDAPHIKRYLNQRNFRGQYSKTVTLDEESRQFEWDFAIPAEITSVDCYAIQASGNRRYSIPIPTFVFDEVIEVSSDIPSGDTWHVVVYNLSAL